LRGREKKAFFNETGSWMVLGFALGGAGVGFAQFGMLGAIIGLGAAVAVGGTFVEEARFYRRSDSCD
jgi:hypothetical protein